MKNLQKLIYKIDVNTIVKDQHNPTFSLIHCFLSVATNSDKRKILKNVHKIQNKNCINN